MAGCNTTNVVQGCFNGTPVLIHVTDDGLGAPATRIMDVTGAIVPGANATNTTPGVCAVTPIERQVVAGGTNIAAGTQAPIFTPSSAVASWSHTSGGALQSVTVTAQRAGTPASGNTVRVRFSATGTEIFLVQGQSQTWSVAQDDGSTSEVLRSDIDVECFGNSAATVAWTEHL